MGISTVDRALRNWGSDLSSYLRTDKEGPKIGEKKMGKSLVKRAIVTPDKHFPYADEPAINCLTKAIEIVKPDIYVDIGDVGEWHAFQHGSLKGRKPHHLNILSKILIRM